MLVTEKRFVLIYELFYIGDNKRSTRFFRSDLDLFTSSISVNRQAMPLDIQMGIEPNPTSTVLLDCGQLMLGANNIIETNVNQTCITDS